MSRLNILFLAAVLFSTIAFTGLYAEAVTNAAITGSRVNGEFDVSVFQDGKWQMAGSPGFNQFFTERTVTICPSANEGILRVKIIRKGGHAAHIDSVLMDGMPPVEAKGTDAPFILKKISRKDLDVIDAFSGGIELVFNATDKPSSLTITGRIEGERISETPFQYPLDNLYKKLDENAKFYTYKLDSIENESPFFKEYSVTGSGHPSGYTYGWVSNDEKNLYVTIDFTPDNTMDGGKDYAKVHVKTAAGVKEFKVSVPETRWGTPDFTYTDKVAYQHKTYDFTIPLMELGIHDVGKKGELELAFSAYGTAAPPDLAITMTDGVATAVPGGSVTYTITAASEGLPPVVGVAGSVSDTFPASLTCTWTCVGAGGGTCTAAGAGNINDTVNLPEGGSVTYTASCTISASATGTLSNTATVTFAGDPNSANNSATDTDTLTPQADFAITKTDGVTSATPGGSVTYTVTASNAGPSDAPGSTVADTFPASLTCTWTCVGAGGGTCTGAGSGNINDTVNLPAGGSVTYTASCAISASATGTLSNTATVNAPGGVTDPTPGNNSATDTNTLMLTFIHDVQGPGASSPLIGNSITTRGIVTGVKSNGFFIQEPDASVDADPATSEGIFVFTSSAPPAAAVVGAYVQVTGTVAEFVPAADPLQPPLTELTSTTVIQLSSGNPLPAAVPLTATFPDPTGVHDQIERLEGMRVSVSSLTVSGPTLGSFNEANATATSTGVFFGTVTGVPSPRREPGIQAPDPAPSGGGTIPPIPRFDANPERIRVDSNGLIGGPLLDVGTGAVVTGLTGPLDYTFRAYTLLPDPGAVLGVSGGPVTTAVATPATPDVTIATVNLRRFFDTVNDPATSDVVLTTAAFDKRLNKASLAIRDNMRIPDIICVVEMENLTTLQALAARISADAIAGSQPDPQYAAYLVEGNDIGGIDVGFLVKAAVVAPAIPRVEVLEVVQELAGTLFVNPDSSNEFLNDRPPLRLMAVVHHTNGTSFPVTVIANHLLSINGINSESPGSNGWPTSGARVRAKRQAQAEALANLVQARQTADPGERIVLLGDFNAYEFNDGLVDVINVIAGTPPPDNETAVPGDGVDLVNPDLVNLVDTPPLGERYSFVFDGQRQNIDHIMVNQAMLAGIAARRIEHPRLNADFPATAANDSSTPARISDHDPVVAFFTTFSSPDLAITKTDGVTTAVPGGSVTYTITASNLGPDPATGATVSDNFPAALICTWTCAGAGGGTCTASGSGDINDTVNLPAGGSVTYSASCTISASATGALSNTATVTEPGGGGVIDPNPANNSATDTDTLTPQADLSITKTDTPDPVTVGNNLTYTITVTNAGPSNAESVTVADTLSADTTFVSLSSPGGWSCSTPAVGGGGTVSCSISNMGSGSAVFTLVVKINSVIAGGVSNTAGVSSATSDPNPDNETASTTTSVVRADQATLTLNAGSPLTYGATETLSVTGGSGTGAVTYQVTSGNCTVVSDQLKADSGAGDCSILANKAADTDYNETTASATVTLQKANTVTAITSDSPDPSVKGSPYTVNFTVTVVGGTAIGNVTVTDGTDNCTADVATGYCSLTSTTAGAKTLIATYEGDANCNGSSSSGAAHQVRDLYTLTVVGAGIDGGTMTSVKIINATWDGSVTGGDNTEQRPEGTGPYTITATAKAGEKVKWTGDCDVKSGNNTAVANCRINTMTGNKSVQAFFMHETPSAPSALVVTALAENKAALTWADNADNEYGFRIERKEEGGSFEQIKMFKADTTACTDVVPAPGKTYVYRVRAYNDGGNSDYTTEETVALTEPSTPTQLRGRAISSSEIVLAWSDNSEIEEGFKLQRKTGDCLSAEAWTDVAGVIGADTIEHITGGLLPDTVYSYQLKAYKGSDESQYSSCETVETGKAGTPFSPSGLEAKAVNANRIDLTWQDNSTDETMFRIYRRVDEGAWALLHTTLAGETSYSDTSALNNSSTSAYMYYITACNTLGCSAWSAWAGVPQQPSGVAVAPDAVSGIMVTWTPLAGEETGYLIYRKTGNCTSTEPWVEVGEITKLAVSYKDEGVLSGNVYSYIVKSVRDSYYHPVATGYSLKSNCSKATAP